MRTKHLFTALALVALFASCAKEELPTVSVETSERAIVENVSFNFVKGAETRLAFDGKAYDFEAGDQLGACLMDVTTDKYGQYLKVLGVKWADQFDFVNYIQTNYKFTRDAEGNWETEAKLCEGNYFLAYPYNKNMGLRKAYTFDCSEQTLAGTDRADLLEAFAKNNSYVGYAKVMSNDNAYESVDVDMVKVFETTGFTLFNTGSQDYTIEKVVLSGAKVEPYAVVNPTNDTYKGTGKNKDVLVYSNGRIDVTLAGENKVASDNSIDIIVLSATSEALAANEDAMLEIHTDKGLIRGINLNEKQTADNGQLNKNATVNVLTDKALSALGKGDKVTVTFDDTSLDVPNEMDIYSTDELYRLVKWNAAVNQVAVEAKLMADVELTTEIYDILKNSGSYGKDKSSLTINGNGQHVVTVEADVEADAMDLVTFTKVDVVVEGTQSITKGINVNVFVEKGATFNVAAGVDARVINNGTVNAKVVSTKVSDVIKTLANNATLTVDGLGLDVKTLYNDGYVVVKAGATLVANGKSTGTIDNYGVLDGELVNDGYIEDVQDPTINNYGKILNVVNNNVIVMKDKEARIQEAEGTGEIDNTIQSDFIAAGVDNTVFVKLSDVNSTELNDIAYNADATKAYISGTLTIMPDKEGNAVVEKLDEIVANGNLTITGKGKLFFKATPSFTVNKKTETIIDNGSTVSLNGGNLIVKGLLTIKNNGKFLCGTYTGNVENYGTLSGSEKVFV